MYKISLSSVRASEAKKEYIQQTDTIILPESQSKKLINRTINKKNTKPLYFFIRKGSSTNFGKDNKGSKQICCRIADYSNPDYSSIILPDWMFDMLELHDKSLITINEVLIEDGRQVTFQPHNKEMLDNISGLNLDISNVLSSVISNYGCLTNNTTIEVAILGKKWKINVTDIKDINGKNKSAISTLNTDLELDLLPALDENESISFKKDTNDNDTNDNEEKISNATSNTPNENVINPQVSNHKGDISQVIEPKNVINPQVDNSKSDISQVIKSENDPLKSENSGENKPLSNKNKPSSNKNISIDEIRLKRLKALGL